MSAEVGIIVKMNNKSARPPPPVPPRPSKSLIKEALAKTRQAHFVSVSKSQALPVTAIQPPKEFQNKRLSFIDNSRPVIYQSENCKSRSICSNKSESKKFEDLKKCHVDKVLKIEENLVAETKDELISKQIESDNDEIKSGNEAENRSTLWEHGFSRNNEEITIAETTKSDEVSSSSSSDSVNINCYSDSNNQENGTLNRNHVNTLIDEMFASVLEVNLSNNSSSTESIIKTTDNKNTTVIVINDEQTKKVKFNDRQNHEFLINELQKMKSEEKILKRQRRSPLNRFDDDSDSDKIQKNDWYTLNQGKKVRMSSCNIKIEDEDDKYLKMKNLSTSYGLPPLPSSLSGFKFIMDTTEKSDPIKINPVVDENSTDGQIMNLEKQLSILRREMDSLREQDLSLLSKLWFLNESIQDFRQMLQDQDDKINLSPCPSPTPSSIEDDDFCVLSASTC